MKLTLNSKKKILDFILDTKTDFLGENDDWDNNSPSFKFLKTIWDIDEMPSTDSRYNNATGDIYQHLVRNSDWEYKYLFTDILKVYDDDEIFIKFIEAFLLPDFRINEEEIYFLSEKLNDILSDENLQLATYDYNSLGQPILKIFNASEVEGVPLEIKKNSIPFFVNRIDETIDPSVKYMQYFILEQYPWDDFGHKTSFILHYYDSKVHTRIGEIKIMHFENPITIDSLEPVFFYLDENYCSLGQRESFFENLVSTFPNSYLDILFALADTAFFTDKLDDFEKNFGFRNSLLRKDFAERTLRVIKYKINNYDLTNQFKFRYKFTPNYSKIPVNIEFDFNNDEAILANRIYAIIGKNGTGKTQLLTSLPINISEEKGDYFEPRVPMFSKLITVSYSIFDRFKIPRKTSKFNYVYCGLKNDKGEFITDRGLLLRFHKNWEKIQKMLRLEKWRSILTNFIDVEILNQFIIADYSINSVRPTYNVDREAFNKMRNRLSSGQNILLYIITEITANIRFDSLLLYDEPETHLHPNAISQLINTIFELVEEFQSYCIIGTHSPLIIQELLSKNVYVLERNGDIPSIRRIGIESFGENLSVLTDDVFGNREIQKQYKKIIDEQITIYNKSYEQVVEQLEFDKMPLSLNVKLYIKSKFVSYEES